MLARELVTLLQITQLREKSHLGPKEMQELDEFMGAILDRGDVPLRAVTGAVLKLKREKRSARPAPDASVSTPLQGNGNGNGNGNGKHRDSLPMFNALRQEVTSWDRAEPNQVAQRVAEVCAGLKVGELQTISRDFLGTGHPRATKSQLVEILSPLIVKELRAVSMPRDAAN